MERPPTREIDVSVEDLRDLFREHEFDPLTDDVNAITSIARLAQLPQFTQDLPNLRLRVLMPKVSVTPQTEALARAALQRYCDHMIAEARRKLAALRWVGWRTLFVGLVLFGLSLAASAAVQRISALPDALRTLASEGLVVAGWVLLWQPLDTLVAGWWPAWEEERTFKAIARIDLTIAPADERLTTA